jgi:hypothetical protein
MMTSAMDKVNYSISVVTGTLLVFAVLCGAEVSIPMGGLLVFLLLFNIGLVWMVITILKEGKESGNRFDDKFYEDVDLGPGNRR